MKWIKSHIAIMVFTLFTQAYATTESRTWELNLNEASGSIQFLAVGRPSFLKIKGKGSAPQGSLFIQKSGIRGSISFNLDSLDTGIKLRNEHMKHKYLEIHKFPKAELKIIKISLPDTLWTDISTSLENVPYEGTLSLHGNQKKIDGLARIKREENDLNITSQFKIKLKDFGIETPSFKGITVSEDVDVSVSFKTPFQIKK